MSELSWGRRLLMCPPDFYEVTYAINPWMDETSRVDRDRAASQWEGLVATLKAAGAEIELQAAVDGLPDLVFSANAGVVNGRQFVPARFKHPERQGEPAETIAWFSARGYRIDELPEGIDQEGAGDALPFGDVVVAGYGPRSEPSASPALSRLLGVPACSVNLVDERLYHLDLTFCPVDDRRAIVAPLGWDRPSARAIEELVAEPLVLDDEETLSFSANSVVVGTTIVMPSCSPRVGKVLESWGLDVVVCQVDEFLKAGGGCRCLTLALDTTF